MLAGGKHSKASDVYSFGLVMWEVLTFQTPFEGQASPWQVRWGHRHALPRHPPPDLWHFSTAMPLQAPAYQLSKDGV